MPATYDPENIVPFESAEEAWFWFIAAQQAKEEGARITAGQSLTPRPCEPVDIFRVLDRLYRGRMVLWDHVLVLKHYGKRGMKPDSFRPNEAHAARLWQEALEKLEEALVAKGIVERDETLFPNDIMQAAIIDFQTRGPWHGNGHIGGGHSYA